MTKNQEEVVNVDQIKTDFDIGEWVKLKNQDSYGFIMDKDVIRDYKGKISSVNYVIEMTIVNSNPKHTSYKRRGYNLEHCVLNLTEEDIRGLIDISLDTLDKEYFNYLVKLLPTH